MITTDDYVCLNLFSILFFSLFACMGFVKIQFISESTNIQMIYEKSAGFPKEVHRSRQLAVHFVVALSMLSVARSTQTRSSVKWGVLGAQY